MLSYDLCLKLKEAGFPQNCEHKFVKTKKGAIGAYNSCELSDYTFSGDTQLGVDMPTLSELIEACGQFFVHLKGFWMGDERKYEAMGGKTLGSLSSVELVTEIGKTPEEAVCNLYLALNHKQ